ncbi:MAG: hypothetical protein IIB77_04320 [Proteobacteria bacterium]|nr:hypothetical protein [Pseudomonadota bacterium]
MQIFSFTARIAGNAWQHRSWTFRRQDARFRIDQRFLRYEPLNPASRSTAGGHRKIQRRLAVKLAVFTILVATVIGSMSSAIEIRNIFAKTSQEIIRSAEQLIELTLGAAAESVYQLDAEIAEDLLYGLMNNEFFVASAIHDELGNELASVSRPRSELTGMVGLIEIPLKEFRYDLPVRGDQSLAGVFTATLDVQSGLAPFYDLAIMTGIAQIFQTIGLALLVFFIAMCLVKTTLSKLARELAGIEPGSEDRLSVSDSHRNDELGRLACIIHELFVRASFSFPQFNSKHTLALRMYFPLP